MFLPVVNKVNKTHTEIWGFVLEFVLVREEIVPKAYHHTFESQSVSESTCI